jgi:hypothetical protein
MHTLYHCPDCKRTHDEPAEAAYVLTVRCLDCALELEYAVVETEPELQPAA